MHRSARSRQRGAAAVEAAISMLVIVPTFLYVLFLDDLLRYSADLQEAVTSTPWDFTVQDYARQGLPPPTRIVERNARLMFCDHQSSGDSYEESRDCRSRDEGVSGQVSWPGGSDQSITCLDPRTNVGDLGDGCGDTLFPQYKGQFGHRGGLFECSARSQVEGTLLPNGFLEWTGVVETSYELAEQRFALVADPWALNDKRLMILPGQRPSGQAPGGDLYERVDLIYRKNLQFPYVAQYTHAFLRDLVSKKTLRGGAAHPEDMLYPSVSVPRLGQAPPSVWIQQDWGTYSYFATPWRDGASDPYAKTHQARGKYYLGCKVEEGC